MTTMRFKDRSVFVTGGASGIGLAAVTAFAADGAKVAIADRDADAGSALAERLRGSGAAALFVPCDATDETAIRAALDTACRAHGPIRHAVNNVGAPRGSTVEGTSLEDWEVALRLNLTSTFLAMKHQIPLMRAGGGGTIVNIASSTATVFNRYAPPAYTAAKAGVVHLSHYASILHGKEGIRVNSVSPGLTATPLVLNNLPPDIQKEVVSDQVIQRLTTPAEIADAILYLSSDGAAMITGTDIEVGGGRIF